jgi:hypothetical protein
LRAAFVAATLTDGVEQVQLVQDAVLGEFAKPPSTQDAEDAEVFAGAILTKRAPLVKQPSVYSV